VVNYNTNMIVQSRHRYLNCEVRDCGGPAGGLAAGPFKSVLIGHKAQEQASGTSSMVCLLW
jgi:hypothetical protein